MKGFFYFRMNLEEPEHSGVRRKFEQILKAFNESGTETDAAFFTNRGLEFEGRSLLEFSANRVMRGWQKNASVNRKLLDDVDFTRYDFAWIRPGLVFPWIYRFIKTAKKQNPNLKIFLEFGTYPFDAELEGFIKRLYRLSEFYLKRLRNDVDKIITFCGQDEIHGIPCIKMRNGIDVGEYNFEPIPPKFNDQLNIVAVSSLHKWHAYDRIIRGMKAYFDSAPNKTKIDLRFHLIGLGEEKAFLDELVSRFDLQEKIIFHGYRSGRELDEIFERSHIAVGTLGMHRIQTQTVSSIKNREYAARAIPFVLATPDADFPAELPFVKMVSGDETPVDMTELIEFYKAFADDRAEEKRMAIRRYAKENLDWKIKIAPVLEETAKQLK